MENEPDWRSVCDKVVKSMIIHLPDSHFQFSVCCCASHPLCPSLFLLLLVSPTPCSGGPPPPAASSAGTSGSNTADKHRVCVTSAGWDGINLRHFQKSLDRAAGHIADSCWDSACVCVFERARVCVCVCVWMQLGDAALRDSHTHFTNTLLGCFSEMDSD